MVGIRTTDSSGNLTQATTETSLTSGSGVSSVPASNAPSGIGSGDGAAWTIKYTASNKTLTFSLGGKVTKTMTINTTTMPYLSFALIGSAGDKSTEMTSSVAQVSGTKASMTVPVTYKDTTGNVLKTKGTTLAVGDGQSVGINNASPKASSDTYSYDAPKITGYNISSANDITVKVGSGTTPSLNLVYAPALQEATVTTSGLVGNSASGNGTTTYKGTTGGAISISDSSLTKAGYTYKVTAPDGQTYDTMAAALAAGTNGKYDATDNASTATTDSQQQAFKVVYTAQPQTAEFTYTGATPQSGSPTTLTGTSDGAIANTALYAPAGYKIDTAATTLASGVSLSMATNQRSATIYGSFDTDTATNQKSTIVFAPLTQTAQIVQVVNGTKSTVETKTGGSNSAIAFSATDSSLAKTGYTYKVTGPNGQVYDTLMQP